MDWGERIATNFMNDPVGDGASVATFIILGVTVFVYFRQKKIDKARHDEERDASRSRASENLYFELEDTFEIVKGVKYPDDYNEVEIRGFDGKTKIVHYTNVLFNHDFYDSLISSGLINFLETELQQSIQNIFRLIKTHNKYLDIITRAPSLITRSAEELSIVTEQNERYLEWIDGAEKVLRKEIPDIMKKLEKHVKTA